MGLGLEGAFPGERVCRSPASGMGAQSPLGRSTEGEGPPGKGLGQVGWAPAEEAQGYQPKKPTQVGPHVAPAGEVDVEKPAQPWRGEQDVTAVME